MAWLILPQIEGLKGICIFASGGGTNADRIMSHFSSTNDMKVVSLVCDKPEAGVLSVAKKHGVPSFLIDRTDLAQPSRLIDHLRSMNVDLIVLAGFLRLLPKPVVQGFKDRIVNIHPSLLPKFGGKGMYGINVHKAVLNANERISGISIHLVNEKYDDGRILFQAECPVQENDSPETLAARVLRLEHEHYPTQIQKLLND